MKMMEIQEDKLKDGPQEKVLSDEPRFKQLTLFDITFDPGMKDDEGNEAPRPYTKNMMRKWLRKVKWENGKAAKRRKEKAHAKERRRKAREENRDLGPSRRALKKMRIEKPKSTIGIIIDLSFEDLMIEKDRYKVIKQILRSYSINRRSAKPVQFHITSLGETTKSDLSRHNGYENWDIKYHEQQYTDIFPPEKIVYLTSESENVIEKFEEDTFYVIGGLVDHNQHKGLCHQIAVEQGIRHAQLPLDKYVNMKTRKVLTIDHVLLHRNLNKFCMKMMEIQEDKLKDGPQEKVLSDEPRFKQLTLFDITFDPGMKDDEGNEAPRPYTKNMMRKWLRKVKWENGKAAKRRKEKAHAKERRRKAREENRDLGPSRRALKKMRIEKPKSTIGIIIDLSFEDLMIEKDRYKVIKQILRSYSINRRSAKPVQFHITSLGETTKSDLSRHNGYENWDIKYHEQQYTDIFPPEKIVYLTSESENVIEKFEEDTFYVIGGLVDHNQHKGLCHQIAVEQGIRHAQLPLDKYVNMKTRKVLTIDHVFEIVVRIIEGMPWQEVLMKVLPMRKGVQACDNVSNSNSNFNDSDSSDDQSD